MEAMSYGIPVIATNVGGVSEIVNNDNGYLIQSDPNPKLVAEKIKGFYNSTLEFKNKKRMAAYKTWESNYNAAKNYSQFVEDILSL